tara:strand:- start:586 stop:1002 length:417 start_codon:yes stop_codon:yes gene_type:complete
VPRLSSRQIAQKQAQRAAAAQTDYVDGVRAVSRAPGEAAAAATDKYRQNTAASVDKWAERTRSVSRESWIASVEAKASRFSQGVAAAEDKTTQFWDEFGPFLDRVTEQTRAMPSTTAEDRINRMVAQARGASEFRSSR